MTSASFSTALDFAGKRALVTGGSRGLGAVISRRLAALGAHVFINYVRDATSAARTRDEIVAAGGSATLVRANLAHLRDVEMMFDEVRSTGGLDILVHNAALGAFKNTFDVRTNQWDLTMSVNARALLWCAQQAAPLMEGRTGRIVSLSSLGSGRVFPSYGAIGVSKAALESLTRYLAVELSARDIVVNAVSAGLICGATLERHPLYESLASRAREGTPRVPCADPNDVASVVLFLCSPMARWIVGQTIVADGGLSLTV